MKAERKEKCYPKILVVDDDEFNIKALCILLANFGYSSHFTFNGELALEMITDRQENSHSNYSLILLDCNMPVMNGYDACR